MFHGGFLMEHDAHLVLGVSSVFVSGVQKEDGDGEEGIPETAGCLQSHTCLTGILRNREMILP